MNKCSRCSNENIKEGYKYCPICGLKLGTALEVPVQEQFNNEFVEKIQKNLPSHFRNIDVSQGSIFYAIVVATINAFQ